MTKSPVQIAIIKELNKMIKDFRQSPNLALVQGHARPEQWKAFIAKRLQSATVFEAVLKNGIALAAEYGHGAIRNALAENLSDETGRQSDGSIDLTKAHETWRKDFAESLQLPASPGYPVYDLMIKQVATSSEPFLVYGLLLALERLIPVEFIYVRAGMDALFPEVFIVTAQDNETVRDNKVIARQYIDDHIDHDAKQHFPDLLDAFEQTAIDSQALGKLSEGIALVSQAKQAFYNDPDIFLN